MHHFDVEAIRQDFPILQRKIHQKPLIYLDNAASTQKPQAVIDSIVHTYSHSYANVHRGVHTLADESTQAVEHTRALLAQHLGASSATDIVFTSGATASLNIAAHTLGTLLNEGDEVWLSLAEHHSNFVPWHMLRARGIVLRALPMLPCGNIDVTQAVHLFGARSKILAVTHMSNVTGYVTDLLPLIRAAQAHNMYTVVDGAQAAAHVPHLAVAQWGVDMYACTAHKMYAPSGVGALYIRPELAHTLPPFLGGGDMIERVSFDHVLYAAPPHRFEAGTPAISSIIGWGAALSYVMPLHEQTIAHEHMVYKHAVACLRDAVPDVTIYGDSTTRKSAILSFTLPHVHHLDAAMYFNLQGIAVRAGMHCAEPLMQYYGINGTLRASFAMYNTLHEAEQLATVAQACVRALS